MNLKKIILTGLVSGLIAFIVGSILYLNPLVMGYYDEHGEWPGAKTPEMFGGMESWLLLMAVGMIVLTVFTVLLYSYVEKAIDFTPTCKKGAFFGLLLWLTYSIPSTYYTWLMSMYPDILLMIDLAISLPSNIIIGIVIAKLYEKIE